MNNTGRNAVLLMIGKGLTSLLSMASVMLLSRGRTLEQYGTYAQLNTVISITSMVFILGLPNSINYFWAGQKEKRDREAFANTYFSAVTVLSLMCGAVLIVAIPVMVRYFDNQMLRKYWFYLLFIPLTKVVLESRSLFLIVNGQAKRLVCYNFLNSTAILCAIVVTGSFQVSFDVYLIIYVCIELFFSGLVVYEVNRITGRVRFAIDKKLISRIFVYSLPIGLSSAVNTLKQECDKLMVSHFFSTQELALYTNAAHELPITLIATSMTAVLLPKIVVLVRKKCYSEGITLWKSGIQVTLYVLAFLVVGMFVYAEDVIKILYSNSYIECVPIFRVYLLTNLIKCTYYGMVLNACGKTSTILKAAVLSLVLNIFANIVGYHCFGLVGPALATVAVGVFSATYQLKATSKLTGIEMRKIFPWKEVLSILVINGLFGFLFYELKCVLPLDKLLSSEVESVFLAVVWGVTYLGVCFTRVKERYQALG